MGRQAKRQVRQVSCSLTKEQKAKIKVGTVLYLVPDLSTLDDAKLAASIGQVAGLVNLENKAHKLVSLVQKAVDTIFRNYCAMECRKGDLAASASKFAESHKVTHLLVGYNAAQADAIVTVLRAVLAINPDFNCNNLKPDLLPGFINMYRQAGSLPALETLKGEESGAQTAGKAYHFSTPAEVDALSQLGIKFKVKPLNISVKVQPALPIAADVKAARSDVITRAMGKSEKQDKSLVRKK